MSAIGHTRWPSIPITISPSFIDSRGITNPPAKRRKGNRVFKTTRVKDEYGNTVYKNTTSHKKKKKKS